LKVMRQTKLHTNLVRVLQFDIHSLTISFFKPDHTGQFSKLEVSVPSSSLLTVQQSVDNPKKLKICFFDGQERLLRNQKEWKILFRTNAERERFARLVTSNLLLRRAGPGESKAKVYEPRPLKIDQHILDRVIKELPVAEVAGDLHDSWLAAKSKEGWTYGSVYNEAEKTHPELQSLHLLSSKEQEYYLEVSASTIGSILELGYCIRSQEEKDHVVDLEEDSYLLLLVEFLAENAHDLWAVNKLKAGWVYGPARSEEKKTHPNLVPYVDLDEAEKDWNRQAAQTVLKALLYRGYSIEPET